MSTPPLHSARMGRWLLTLVPPNWFFVPGFGLRHNGPYPTSNITVKEDMLLAGKALRPYVQAQTTLLKRTYLDPAFAGPQACEMVAGSEESMMLLVRHQPLNGTRVMQAQTYARAGTWLGIVTLTTVEAKLDQARRDYQQFVRSLSIVPAEVAADA